jgi:hypothetical protein
MLEFLTQGDLAQVHADLGDLVGLLSLMQVKRRERGAYVKPGLADSVKIAERRLLASFDQLAQDVVASLVGQADDVASGRIAQADDPTDAEVAAAVRHFDIPLDEMEKPVDRHRLEAILALLLLWRRRHQAIADAQIKSLFGIGHQQAMADAGQTAVMPAEAQTVLRGDAEQQFNADLDRLETALRDGTGKAKGIRAIVLTAGSVGAASALILDLFNQTKFRVEMFAEAMVWTAWMDGFRSGAVDATHAALRTAGVDTTNGISLTDLSPEVLAKLPQFQWTGPDDEKTCSPCKARFGAPIVVFSIDDMPAPETICRFKRSCRHWWQRV